jgi:hypothetical protein
MTATVAGVSILLTWSVIGQAFSAYPMSGQPLSAQEVAEQMAMK